ncbi:unnamed protein product [Cuscuta campestris]|uniref:Uncharacterized protein n=1 Tax=Cuscuta campestris TaxID=132261 RepID=A0A484LVR5_9ASTE|nr:unnamed protein product [Cuscuta campestris]
MKDINEMKSLFCAHFNSEYDELIGYSEEHWLSIQCLFPQTKQHSMFVLQDGAYFECQRGKNEDLELLLSSLMTCARANSLFGM